MKYIFMFLLIIYKVFFSFMLNNIFGIGKICRFTPTCSEYAKIAILKLGLVKGSYYALLRLLQCQPYIRFQFGAVHTISSL